MDLKKIEEIAKKGFSFMDIVLIYQAELNKCDYFVTREKALCSSEYLKKEFNLKICHPKEFINIIGYDKVKKIRYSIPLKPK